MAIKIRKGARKVITCTWWTTSAKTTVKDLTGYTARAQIRKDFGSTDVMLDIDTSGGGIVITPGTAEGNLVITIDDSDLTNVPVGEYIMDVMTLVGGEPSHPIIVPVEVLPSFTPAVIP